jgi:hypothetical protein
LLRLLPYRSSRGRVETDLFRGSLVLPVRDMHVLYGLKREHYAEFARHQLPHAHEFFAPMDALTATDGAKNPELHTLLARASATANFMSVPASPTRIEQDRVDR